MTRQLNCADLFAGAGGTSCGAEMTGGARVRFAVNHWAIVDAKATWFYRMIGGAIVWTIGPGRRTANGVPFIQLGSNSWVALSDMLARWERSESLTGPWEPVQ